MVLNHFYAKKDLKKNTHFINKITASGTEAKESFTVRFLHYRDVKSLRTLAPWPPSHH